MTLEEILALLNANITANGGTLKLAPQTIPSPGITELFDRYLLSRDLVVEQAVAGLNASDVTVTGKGNSLIFFKTTIAALTFTVIDGVAAMSVKADAIIAEKDGWTFGASFPVLKNSRWGGFLDPGNKDKWVQYIFFSSANFSLSLAGLDFSGSLKLVGQLKPLAALFGFDETEVKGKITLNKGENYAVTPETVVPEMMLIGQIGTVGLKLDSFPTFTLEFSMNASAYIVPSGDQKGKPVPILELLIETTMPFNGEKIGIAIVVGTQASLLTMRAILPEDSDVGLSELITLANNENLLAIMPSNIPVIYDFIVQDWQLTFNTKARTISMVAIEVVTREIFSWAVIPGFLTLKKIGLYFLMGYENGKLSPSLSIEGTVAIGPVNFTISAAFPSFVFMGALDPQTPVNLRSVIISLLGEDIGSSLPSTLELGILNLAVDPNNSTYSFDAALTTQLEIPVILTKIILTEVSFNINYVAGTATGSITGDFEIGTDPKAPKLFVTAAYKGQKEGWLFSGGLKDGSQIKLSYLIKNYLPEQYRDFNTEGITITNLYAEFNQAPVPAQGEPDKARNAYKFRLGAQWKLDLGLSEPLLITALTEISYKQTTTGSPYSGFIQGAVNFGNIGLSAKVDFSASAQIYTFTFLNRFTATFKSPQNGEDSIITFNFTDETSLGSMIGLLVSAATGQDIALPSPWNVMNNIKLKNFTFSFNLTKNKIGFSYSTNINLGFVDLKGIALYYTYFPNDPGKEGIVEIQLQGSFLGGPAPGPWNVAKPETAPPVPGKGENLFRLEFLGMGQHVSLQNGLSPKSVAEAIDLLKAGFERKDDQKPASPISGTGLKFNSSSNWLIGTQFVIVDTFAVGIVFFDPDMYGLSLYADGPKAKIFQGLKFEILYKKISDTVGVYQVYLKLPDAIRQLDFGAVSVTLPSVRIYIYTNGDFKVDFGFPVNDDYSESFGLQLLPFVGSGGFYFGVLSAETAETVPVASNGNFSPVIVFGVGLRVGIGKEINKGILKAGISIVVQGILEGTYAPFNYFEDKPANIENPTYYYILGKIAIVGHVYGSVNFLIISAEVDLKVFVSSRIVLESYEPILIALSAGVSVSVRVKINLGLFKISIGMSFSTTIQESFTVGSRQPKPWIVNSLHAAQFRELSLRALDAGNPCVVIPEMNWQPVIPASAESLDILFIPQFTAATDGEVTTGPKARAVAMLYLESSIDQPSQKKAVVKNGIKTEEDYAFNKFAKGVFLWVLGAYFNKTDQGMPVETILAETITIAKLNEIICYFSQDDLVEPFLLDDVFKFMENYLKATVVIPPRATAIEAETTVSVLPMLPNLIFDTPGGEIYFDNEHAEYKYDQKQLELIRRYFNALAVRNNDNAGAEEKPVQGFAEEERQSLATFMLIDYISLLAKESCQKGIDRMTALGLTVAHGDSMEDIVARYPHFGISAIELAHSNRTRSLREGNTVNVGRLDYTIKHNDTLESVSARFKVGHNEILQANTRLQQTTDPNESKPLYQVELGSGFGENNTLVPGATIVIPGIKHVTSSANGRADSLLSIARRYGVNVVDLIAENTSTEGLFPAGKKILVPFVENMTVAGLIAAMDENHDFEQLSGLSANIMLQGLRVPLPEKDSKIGEPQALYKISGQQIDASALAVEESLTLKLAEPLDWLKLGAKGGIELPYVLEPEDIKALQAIQDAPLQPVIIDLAANPLFEVQPRKFTLPTNIAWQSPAAIKLANGTSELPDTVDPSIWMFQASLQAILSGYDAIAPKVALLKQVQETKTTTSKPQPIIDYSWSTKIDLRLTQVRSSEDPAQLMPNVYELQGIDQGSMVLLKNLIEYYGENPETGIIRQIEVLYSKEPARDGQTAPPNGLRSDSIENTSMYLLQTNLSTLSNPPQSGAAAMLGATPGTQENLLGMTQIEFLRYAWEAAIVNTGGYYFYYQVKDSKAGLPEYLFNGNTDNIISLVITYNITDNVLLSFLNSAVVREPINIDDEILYVEALAQTVTDAMPEPGETLQSFARRYGTTVSKIAIRNQKALFTANVPLHIPQGINTVNGLYLPATHETLLSVAEKHGISVIALAHANKNGSGLFAEPLAFDTRIEVKVATVPPGNIGFSMKRENPENIDGLDAAELNLQQLYNLLGYNVAGNEEFDASVSGLPVAPGDKDHEPPTDLDAIARPSAEEAKDYRYDRILPIYPFAKAPPQEPVVGDVPPEKENPYRAVGKTAQIDLRWQDIFGNLTAFTNTGGPATLPAQKIGYIDPVIGISLYPSVSASYIIGKQAGVAPQLQVTLAFNPTPYVPVRPEDDSWYGRASSDREAYRQIYYQLLQTDLKVNISNSLEGAQSIKSIEDTAKTTLSGLVLSIYQYLGVLIAGQASPYIFYLVENDGETLEELATQYGTTPANIRRINPSISADGILKKGETIIILPIMIPMDEVIQTPVSDNNKESLFPLVTTLTLSRDINLVDDNFKDEPSVVFSASVLGPNLKHNASGDNTNSITIQEFARKLQEAFPELRAASGTPQIGGDNNSALEIWVARFDGSSTGIQFSIPNAGNPFYFALLPLASHLMSRENVKIYPYETGTPISEMNPVDASFNGVDIEKLAQTCLAAIDIFLQADFAIPAWQVEQAKSRTGDGGILFPYQEVINAKKTLAENIVKHMETVLEDGNIPGESNLRNAQERLKQELLISLSNAYSVDTVLQFNVEVASQYNNPETIAPNLFGKVIDPENTTQKDQTAYAFSTTRISLENSGGDTGEQSCLTILFNSKKESSLKLESGYFPIRLQYEINSIEHDIAKVAGIDGYQSSAWLTFILPFDAEDTQLGNLKIPVPLRAYPTSPSLTAQTFESGRADHFTEEDKLEQAKEWDYQYAYDYLRADQDTINTDIILNVPSSSLQARFFADEESPDLFAALLQFSSAYQGIQQDFNRDLLDQSNQENAYTAMQSFAWLVKRVADAWGNWAEDKNRYNDALSAQANYKYQITEGEKEIDGQDALLITVTPEPGTDFAIPEVEISGFETDTVEDKPEVKRYVYYTEQDEIRTYLDPEKGRAITQRNIWYRDFNILEQENVWSGISVIRNKVLVPGVQTNPNFIYTTPTIRFISVLTPLLDPDITINIADYTTATGKQKLDVYLSNFLKALFAELADETTSRQIKAGINYSYNIQEGVDSLRTVIPISLTTPLDLPIPGGWQTDACPVDPDDITPDSTFVCQLSALIQKWFDANRPMTTNAQFELDISLFAGLSNTQLPILRLRNLYLNETDIQWN